MRLKEINMDKDKPKVAQIEWRIPVKLNIDKKSLNIIEIEINSKEKKIIDDICKKVLSVTYLNEQSISEPKENESKLFSFSDENIPKIENSKIATYTNDTTLDDVIKYIETKNGIINEENIKEVKSKLDEVENLSTETKNKIIKELETQLNKNNQKNNNDDKIKNFNNNNNVNLNNNMNNSNIINQMNNGFFPHTNLIPNFNGLPEFNNFNNF